jgi:hypothetical protein
MRALAVLVMVTTTSCASWHFFPNEEIIAAYRKAARECRSVAAISSHPYESVIEAERCLQRRGFPTPRARVN